MERTKILPADAPTVDRLRVHAARMVEDETVAHIGRGYSTERWEREDLQNLLDQAADELEAAQRKGQS